MKRRFFISSLTILLGLLPMLTAQMENSPSAIRVSSLLGWLGGGLLSASLLLMVREPALTAWFGGLERMYRWHHWFGTLGYIAVLAHVIALAVPNLFHDPTLAWPSIAPWKLGWSGILGWLSLLGFMAGLAGTFMMHLRYSLWRFLHAALAVAVILGIAHIAITRGFSLSAGLIFLLTAIALAWRFLRTNRGIDSRPYEVTSVTHLSNDIAEVTFRPLATPLIITPGQFVMIAFFEGPHYRGCGEYHPLTISNIENDNRITVTVKALGDCTKNIQSLRPGVATRIQGPYGVFLADRASRPEVWIAGGIGITPFMAVLRASVVKQSTVLIYTYRNAHDTPYLDELAVISERESLLEYYPLVVQKDISPVIEILRSISDLDIRHIYLCGPPPMVTDITSWLHERDVQSSRIHTESYDLR